MADEPVVARGYEEYGNDRSAVQLPISCHSLAAHMADLSKKVTAALSSCQGFTLQIRWSKASTDYLINLMDNLWTLNPAQTLEKNYEKKMGKPKKFGWRRKVIGTFQVPSIFRYVWDIKYLMYTLGSMTSLMHGMSYVQAGVYSGYPCQYKDWGFFQVCCFCWKDGHSRHWVRGCIPACSA